MLLPGVNAMFFTHINATIEEKSHYVIMTLRHVHMLFSVAVFFFFILFWYPTHTGKQQMCNHD